MQTWNWGWSNNLFRCKIIFKLKVQCIVYEKKNVLIYIIIKQGITIEKYFRKINNGNANKHTLMN